MENQKKIRGLSKKDIESLSNNTTLINKVKKRFNYISVKAVNNFIKLILNQKQKINLKEIATNYSRIFQYNKFVLDKETLYFKEDFLDQMRLYINNLVNKIEGTLKELNVIDNGDEKKWETEKTNGHITYLLDEFTEFADVRKKICDEMGNAKFQFKFDKPCVDLDILRNKKTLQRVEINVVSNAEKIDWPLIHVFECFKCKSRFTKKVYETVSDNHKFVCEGEYQDVNLKTGKVEEKRCRKVLNPDIARSEISECYCFQFSYKDEKGQSRVASAFSFFDVEPGYKEAVLLKIANEKMIECFLLMDIRKINYKKIDIPKKQDSENFVFTLQKTFDNYIEEQTHQKIYGLIPIKCALIIQKAFSYFNEELIANVQLVGDASTGKSMLLEYYGFLLYNNLFLSSDGVSISIPAMRGTAISVYVMGKVVKKVSLGYLGIYDCIHIDEAGEERELVTKLKTFLLKPVYGNNKADGDNASKVRTAQCNLSENLNHEHLGMYIGMIKKLYNHPNTIIDGVEKPEWDENWDLHAPIYKYDNLVLRKVIDEVRRNIENKKKFWIDGHDMALHQRFSFHFYLTINKKLDELNKVISKNVSKNVIFNHSEIVNALKTNSINEYFESCRPYLNSESDHINFDKIEGILKQYKINYVPRLKKFYCKVLKMSRIINKRKNINDEDFYLLKLFLETTNCKLDVADTNTYDIKGPPDLTKEKEINEKIEKSEQENSTFENKLGEDEFE